MDPHIFADPDPGSQNLADPPDPDPKNWLLVIMIKSDVLFLVSSSCSNYKSFLPICNTF